MEKRLDSPRRVEDICPPVLARHGSIVIIVTACPAPDKSVIKKMDAGKFPAALSQATESRVVPDRGIEPVCHRKTGSRNQGNIVLPEPISEFRFCGGADFSRMLTAKISMDAVDKLFRFSAGN